MLFDFPKTAAWLNTDEPTLLALVETGDVPPPMLLGGRLVRWSESALSAWADDDCPAGNPPSEAEFIKIRSLQVEEYASHHCKKPRPRGT